MSRTERRLAAGGLGVTAPMDGLWKGYRRDPRAAKADGAGVGVDLASLASGLQLSENTGCDLDNLGRTLREDAVLDPRLLCAAVLCAPLTAVLLPCARCEPFMQQVTSQIRGSYHLKMKR